MLHIYCVVGIVVLLLALWCQSFLPEAEEQDVDPWLKESPTLAGSNLDLIWTTDDGLSVVPEGQSWMREKKVVSSVQQWFEHFGVGLKQAQQAARRWRQAGGSPQSDDIEIAVSYFRIRSARPQVVWECAPANGYSSLYILHAIRDTGHGHLYSFGQEPTEEVTRMMRECCPDVMHLWTYVQGDVERFFNFFDVITKMGVAAPNYVYLDALHERWFGQMYAEKLLRKLQNHTFVSIHDAYRDGWSFTKNKKSNSIAMPEIAGAFAELQKAPPSKVCGGFTFSRSFHPALHSKMAEIYNSYTEQDATSPSIEEYGSQSEALDPTVYFELNSPSCE